MPDNAAIALALPLAAHRLRAQTGHDAELAAYKADPLLFIDSCVKTFDPRILPYHLDFRLYDYQRAYILWLEEHLRAGTDCFTEKSRDMGASWLELADDVWHWVFDDAYQVLIGSRKEDLVDNWQLDSHFGRLDYIIKRLPAWLLPGGWQRNYMKIVNLANGNAFLGESANPDFSRQGRYNKIFLDEFGFWPWARSVWTASADSSLCRVVVTTAAPGSFAKELRYSGRIDVKSLHWRLHPKKDEAWYKVEGQRRTPEDVASELDINWEGAVRGRVYPEWEMIPRGNYPFQPGWPLYTSWDFGLDGTALIWAQRNPKTAKWRLIDCYSNSNKTIDFYVPWSTGVIASGLPYGYSEAELAQIEEHRGWPGATHFGDPDVAKRNLETGRSTRQLLAQHGIHVQTRPDVNSFEARQQATKLFLRNIEGLNMPACTALDDAMANARFPERPENSQITSEKVLPIHDWSSHFRTSCEYLAVNEPRVANSGARIPTRGVGRYGSRVLAGKEGRMRRW